MFDIISIGDATIDTFLFIHDIEIKNINGKEKAVFSWGDKLPVDELYKSVAGNAANNAIGSVRLGLKAAYYTVLAHDAGGREIIHKMKKEGVSDRYIVTDDKHSTNASFVISYQGERTIFVYHQHRHYDLPKLVQSQWVYLTSMGEGFESIYSDMCKYIDRFHARLGFNPGTFMLRAGSKVNAQILKRTDLLSLNVEEAQSWVGENGRDPEELCKRLINLGPKAVALTDGRRGAYSYSKEGFFYCPEYPGERVEATGAGDSFTTAYIAALFYGLPHAEALRWGPVNAGSVVQKIGPQTGLLSKKDLESRLKRLKSFRVIPITDEASKRKVMEIVSKKTD
ncbi:MAG: carbohydrate kinase family protein [Candidatus Doudnabacteria bacterium]|nr:carbohydrate kinase family protein [Candidatus Doudnabacteria bacterium]